MEINYLQAYTYSHIPVTISTALVPHAWLLFFMETIQASFSAHTSKTKDVDEIVTMIMILTIIVSLKLFQTQLFLSFNTLVHHIRACFKI